MNNIVELLQRYLESTSNNQLLKEFLESCLENGVFYIRENAETIIKFINTNINSSFEREKGLLLLLVFLQQIPVEVFSNNALSWMLHCNKFLFQSCGVIDGLSIKALTRLIKLSVKFPEINKETAKQIIPKFLLDNVKRKTNIQVSVELLDCLHVCMSEYPGPSGEFKGDILKLLLRTVETKPVIVGVAARCVPLIARIGGGGKQGVSHKTSWQQQQFSLVSLLHSLLNKIYEHIDCLLISESMSECEVLKLEPVKEKNVLLRTQRLATQFTSVAHFLQAMLLDEFPVAKLVAPNAILDVITHAQKPTHASLSTSIEAQAVLSVLPIIQMAALRLLESLVLCLGRNTVPYGSQVCYLCSQVIIWTHQQNTDWPYAMDKPFSNTRLAAYCCLLSWLSVVGAASHLDMLMEKVLPIMLADIHVEKPTVRLRIGSKLSKGKRKQQMVFSEEDHSEKLGNCVANSRLCEKSVQTLALVVRTSVSTLKPETYKNITDTVLKLTAELPIPYSDANCHCALYQLLLTLCLQTHPFVAPPLAPAIAIFTSGLHHFNPQVKATCTSALSSLGRMIRPIAPTLYFPIPQENSKLPSRESSVENNTADHTDTKSKKRKMDLTDGDSDMSENSDSRSNITFLPVQEEPQPLSKVNLNSKVSDSPNGIVELSPVVSKPKINDVGIGTQNEDEDLESINTKMEEDNAIKIEDDKNSILLKENDKLSIFKEDSNKVEETGKGSDTTSKEKITVIPDNNLHNLTNSVDLKNEVLPEQKDPDVVEMLMDFQDEVDSGNEI